jgi:hypothetical protein
MTDKNVVQPELDDLNPPQPVEQINEIEPREDDVWVAAGRRSGKVSLAPGATVIRDHRVVGAGEPCIEPGCAAKNRTDHQFHLRVTKVGGKFHGPDASHLEDLIAGGWIKNTPESFERIQKEIEVGQIRGVTPTDRCPMCKAAVGRNEKTGELLPVCPEGHRTYLPELAPRSTAQIRRQWARDLQGGPEAVKRREEEARRDESKLLRDAVREGNSELVAALTAILNNNGKES